MLGAAQTPRRMLCQSCQRPIATCFCDLVQRVPSKVELLILQHPLEVAQTKGTARLLHACLSHSCLVVGEQFAPSALAQLLQGGTSKTNVLLYPPTPDCAALGILPPPTFSVETLENPANIRLIVLDATWRKSRKMLYLNPDLQALPRLTIAPQWMPAPRYVIRKAQQANQLSTLEASCAALAQLEQDAGKFAPIRQAFDAFVARQLGFMLGQQANESDANPLPRARTDHCGINDYAR